MVLFCLKRRETYHGMANGKQCSSLSPFLPFVQHSSVISKWLQMPAGIPGKPSLILHYVEILCFILWQFRLTSNHHLLGWRKRRGERWKQITSSPSSSKDASQCFFVPFVLCRNKLSLSLQALSFHLHLCWSHQWAQMDIEFNYKEIFLIKRNENSAIVSHEFGTGSKSVGIVL